MSETTSRQAAWPGAIFALGRVAVVIALVAAAFVWTVSGRRRAAPVPPAGYLQVDLETSPIALDPRFATDAISARVGEMVFDALVRVDAHGRFVGDLAESFERPTPTTLVFHLRRGLRFSDGRPLTARDIKYTYDSILDPASISPKRIGLRQLAAIAAPDDATVVMTTKGPYAPALEMATMGIVPAGTPLPGKGVSRWPAASGAFEIASFSRDEALVLARNPARTRAPGEIPGIVFKVVPDPTVRALELAEGVCDLAENNIQPDLLGYLGMRPDLVINQSPGSEYYYLAFNFRDPRLGDLRVRQAIAYAINRKAILGSLYKDTGRLASGMLAPENWAYDGAVPRYPYDPFKASKLLDEAGYTIGPTGTRNLKFVYKTTPEGRRLGEAIQAMLKEIGITLDIQTNEFATFYSDIQKGNFDLTSLDWVATDLTHQYFMVFDSKMTPPAGSNRGGYSNLTMDRLLEQAEVTLDPAARRAIYAEVQKTAATDLPYVSLWWMNNVVVMNRRVKGFTPFPDGSLRSLATVSLSPETRSGRR
ncbi:MAG TPA: ABC transporter substrate-binding protein [Candidatus Binataceae bacterium]|nr:ABC transporter substrate-binding protein [Candidatus Binataceae bacterium]